MVLAGGPWKVGQFSSISRSQADDLYPDKTATESAIGRVDPGMAATVSQSLRGSPTAPYWSPSLGVYPNDHGGVNNGSTDATDAFTDAVATAEANSVPLLMAGGGYSAGYVISAPIVLPRQGSSPRDKSVPLIGMGRSDTVLEMDGAFPANRAMVEWESTSARVYNGHIQGIRFVLANVAGTKAIWHQRVNTTASLSAIMAEWLHCNMADLAFEGNNDYHEVFIDLEVGNRYASMVDLYGDPTRPTGEHTTYGTLLVRVGHDYSGSVPSAHEDSVGLSYCQVGNWNSNVIRGGFSRLFSGRMMGCTQAGGFCNGALYAHGDAIHHRASGNTRIVNIGTEGWSERSSYHFENCTNIDIDGAILGVPDRPGGGPYDGWDASTAYVAGDQVIPTALVDSGITLSTSSKYFEAQNSGTSGASEPTWPDAIGATVVDNGITWEAIGEALGDSIVLENCHRVKWHGRTQSPGSPVVSKRLKKAVTMDASCSDCDFTDFDVRVVSHAAVADEFEILGTRCRVTGISVGGSSASPTYQPYAVGGPADLSGAGSPEGVITAPIGSTWKRTDGGSGTSFYVKQLGSGNTGWVAK